MRSRLLTLKQWKRLNAYQMGYVWYLQAEHPNSPLKGQANPWPAGTASHDRFNEGTQAAAAVAQDHEED